MSAPSQYLPEHRLTALEIAVASILEVKPKLDRIDEKLDRLTADGGPLTQLRELAISAASRAEVASTSHAALERRFEACRAEHHKARRNHYGIEHAAMIKEQDEAESASEQSAQAWPRWLTPVLIVVALGAGIGGRAAFEWAVQLAAKLIAFAAGN